MFCVCITIPSPSRPRCEFIKLAPTPVSDAHMIFRELHYPPREPREIRAWLRLIISFRHVGGHYFRYDPRAAGRTMIHIVVSCACRIPVLIGNITGRRASVNQGFSKATEIYPENYHLSLTFSLDFTSPKLLMLNINPTAALIISLT